MNVDEIRRYCLAFPDARENLQWGDDLCFKVRGKIFVMVGLDHPRMCFKCAPDAFAELIEREDIHPAPYVGRYKWVMLDRLDALGNGELKAFLRLSYEMVEANAPKKISGKPDKKQESGKADRKKKTAARKRRASKPATKKH